jgi:ankyrin repeat protein
MEDGVKILSPDIRVNAGLWICSLYDFTGLGKIYLQMGADIEYTHALDQTPLHIAAANSSAGMLKLLLDAGADTDRTDEDGMNALHHCCVAGLSEGVSLLIKQGVEVNTAGCCCAPRTPCSCGMGRTPLQLAAIHGHPVIVKLLLDACSNLSVIRSSPKEAILHFALEYGSENVVQNLLDWEINFEPGAAESENVLQLATKERHTAIARLLKEADTRTSHATSDDERYLEKAFQPLGAGDTVRWFQELSVEEDSPSGSFSLVLPSLELNNPMLTIPTI